MGKYALERMVGSQAVIQAARICRQVYNSLVKDTISKVDKSPVTIADYAVQAVINHIIEKEFPADQIVG
jgi:3'(2'), 5'-bisphosphate nucleotidase